jgi:uncharacterized protein (DUF983 family)
MFVRALFAHCPNCGAGRIFKNWFKPHRRCPRCGLVLERGEGAMTGSMSINIGMTAATIIAFLVIWLIFDLPDLQLGKAIAAGAAVAAIVPLAIFPVCKTVWAAIDLWLHGYDAAYLDPDEARRLERGG